MHALQVLLFSAPFLLELLKQDPTNNPNFASTTPSQPSAQTTTNVLRIFFAQMVNESCASPQSRHSIITLPIQSALDKRFNCGSTQEDAEEFLTYLLNEIANSVTSERNPAYCMRGTSVQTCECLKCHHKSLVESPFFMWPIPLPSSCLEINGAVQLSNLFLDSCQLGESMKGENQYHCSQLECGGMQDGHTHCTIQSAPDILGLHLKRFTSQGGDGTRKLMTTVNIDDTLQLFCAGEAESSIKYNLFSMVMHDGTRDKGHYFTICRCSGCAASDDISSCSSLRADRAEWSVLDDEYVSEKMTLSACIAASMKTYPNATSYLVFYAHSSSKPCPVCCNNGSRVKEIARGLLPPSPPPPSPPPPPPPQPDNAGAGENDPPTHLPTHPPTHHPHNTPTHPNTPTHQLPPTSNL
jgi:ubiquitin C-terminal hydrolase